MSLAYGLVALAVVLALQAALGTWAYGAARWMDLMLVPVAWYALHGKQRSAMLAGAVGGLLQDAWFQTDILGFNGFKKTLVGWILGLLGARFDLNHALGRFASGALLSVADQFLGMGLFRLLGQRAVLPPWGDVALRALVMALIVSLVFVMLDRVKTPDKSVRPRPRQAGRTF